MYELLKDSYGEGDITSNMIAIDAFDFAAAFIAERDKGLGINNAIKVKPLVFKKWHDDHWIADNPFRYEVYKNNSGFTCRDSDSTWSTETFDEAIAQLNENHRYDVLQCVEEFK